MGNLQQHDSSATGSVQQLDGRSSHSLVRHSPSVVLEHQRTEPAKRLRDFVGQFTRNIIVTDISAGGVLQVAPANSSRWSIRFFVDPAVIFTPVWLGVSGMSSPLGWTVGQGTPYFKYKDDPTLVGGEWFAEDFDFVLTDFTVIEEYFW